jgi:hypothetical protein
MAKENVSTKRSINLDEVDDNSILGILPKEEMCNVHLINFELVSAISKDKKLPYKSINFRFREIDTNNESTIMIIEPAQLTDSTSDEDAVKIQRRLVQLKHMVTAFTVEDKLEIVWDDTSTFDEVFEKCKSKLREDYMETPARLKLTYAPDGKNVQIPLFPPFISTEAKPRELRVTPNDNFKPVALAPKTEGAASSTPGAKPKAKW